MLLSSLIEQTLGQGDFSNFNKLQSNSLKRILKSAILVISLFKDRSRQLRKKFLNLSKFLLSGHYTVMRKLL